MFEWVAKIPGNEFLLYFSLVSLVCILVGWWLVGGSAREYPLPDKNKLDPIMFAALRGGWQSVIDVVVVELIERNVLKIGEKSGKKILSIKTKAVDLSPVEAVVYQYLKVPKSGAEFNGEGMKFAMENALQPVYHEGERQHLLKTAEEVFHDKFVTYFIMFCLGTLGMTKIYFATIYNKPFALLVVLMVMEYFVISRIMKPGDRLTSLGRNYIKEVNQHFSWLKTDVADQRQDHSSLHRYALGTAIFGVGILASSEIFDSYQAFAQSRRYGVGDGGGIYSSGDGGDSGSSSGCGGCGGGGD